MRFFAASLLLLVLGGTVGYLIRDARDPSPGPRRERALAAEPEPAGEREPTGEPAPPPAPTARPAAGSEQPTAGPAAARPREGEPGEVGEGPEGKEEEHPLFRLLENSLPLMKANAERSAREKAGRLARELNLLPHRAQRLTEALVADEVRQLELGLAPLVRGEEPDPAAMALLAQDEEGLMSAGLERDLAGILNAHEIDRVRESLRKEKEAEARAELDSKVSALALPDLTADQERRLREVLRSEAAGEKESEPGPAGTSLKEALKRELSEEEVVKSLEESYKARREKLSAFLTPAQLERLDEHHRQEVREAKLAAGIFGGMLGAKVEVESKTGK